MAVTMIAGMADGIATAHRAARRRAPNGLSALPVHRGHIPTVPQRVPRERRRCAAAIPAMANTSTGTTTALDVNDLGD